MNNSPSDQNESAVEAQTARSDIFYTLGIEFIFVMIPLIFICSVMIFHGRLTDFWSDFEWSFVAAVLLGLTMVKLISGSMSGKTRPRWQPIVLLFAVVLIVMIVNFVLLSMAYSEHLPPRLGNATNSASNMNNVTNAASGTGISSAHVDTHSKRSIAVIQAIFFVVSCLTFFVIGGYGQWRLAKAERGE